jgi:AbrB family looped-hinge helix DNA binding protein
VSESTISSKGQVTIPKAIRTRMHLKVGDRLRFVVEADGSVRLAAASRYLKSHCSSDDPALLSDTTAQLRAADASAVGTALHRYRSSSADFADCLLGMNNMSAGCDSACLPKPAGI